MKLHLDMNRQIGRMKPLHGVNNCPIRFHDEKIPEFEEAGIPFVRTHDSGGPYGRNILVDIPNLFRNFDADPENPESYDFAFTDVYLRNLINSGCRIFFRLGITIENFYNIKAYRTAPPKDFKQWARICEGIIRHYNHGWADGFHYGIEYWEIWNEPENPPMWAGSMEEYFRLYSTAATYLKQRFPEIRVGGYASCGFYAVTRPGMSEFYRNFIRWFDEFLVYVKKTEAPLDFFSWHLYAYNLDELVAHAEYVSEKLRVAGLGSVENIFNEWNFIDKTVKGNAVFDSMKEMPGALFIGSAFCRMQNSPIDKAMYYDAEPTRTYCGLFYFPSERVTKTYYSFKAYHELYRLGFQVACSLSGEKEIFALAATDQISGALLLVNRSREECKMILPVCGEYGKTEVLLLDETHNLETVDFLLHNLLLTLPAQSLILLKFFPRIKAESDAEAKPSQEVKEKRKNFAGLAE